MAQRGWHIIPNDWIHLNSVINELGYLILNADTSLSDLIADDIAVSDKLDSEETAWRSAVDSTETFLSDEIVAGGGILASDLKFVSDALASEEIYLSDSILSVASDMTYLAANHPHPDVNTTASPVFAGLTVDTSTIKVFPTTHRLGLGNATENTYCFLNVDSGTNQYGMLLWCNYNQPNWYQGNNFFLLNQYSGSPASIGLAATGSDGLAHRGGILARARPDLGEYYGQLEFYTRGVAPDTCKLFIGTDGKVGVGTTTPNDELEVAGTIRANEGLTVDTDTICGDWENHRLYIGGGLQYTGDTNHAFDYPAKLSVTGTLAAVATGGEHLIANNTAVMNVGAVWNQNSGGCSALRYCRASGGEHGALGVANPNQTPFGGANGSCYIEASNFTDDLYGNFRIVNTRPGVAQKLRFEMDENNDIYFYDIDGNKVITLLSNGYFGLGNNTSPAYPFVSRSHTNYFGQTTDLGLIVSNHVTWSGCAITCNAFYDGLWERINIAKPAIYQDFNPNGENVIWSVKFVEAAANPISWIDYLILDPNGNFGVGITDPLENLHVAGKIRTDSVYNVNGTDGISNSDSGIVKNLTTSGGIVTAKSAAVVGTDYDNYWTRTGTVMTTRDGGDTLTIPEVNLNTTQGGSWNPSANLVSHWKMNDNAANTTVIDSSPNGYNGVAAQNTNVLSTSGKINTALTFDDATDYVEITSESPFDFTAASTFSVSFWIYATDPGGGYPTVLSKHREGQISGFSIGFDGAGKMRFLADLSYVVSSDTSIALSEWQHWTVVFNTIADVKIYCNSVLDKSGSVFNLNVNNYKLVFGRLYDNDNQGNFFGTIDDIRIYNKALSETEIFGIYNSSNGTENESGTITYGGIARFMAGFQPVAPLAGQIYFTGLHFMGYDGSAWKQLD